MHKKTGYYQPASKLEGLLEISLLNFSLKGPVEVFRGKFVSVEVYFLNHYFLAYSFLLEFGLGGSAMKE